MYSLRLANDSNDLELPKRAPGLGDIVDSSMESDSDVSVSPSVDGMKEDLDPMATLKAPEQSSTQFGVSTTPNGARSTETGCKSEPRSNGETSFKDPPTKPIPQQQQQQLNYIEPCNLDLGSNTTTTTNSLTINRSTTNSVGPNPTSSSAHPVSTDNGPTGALGKLRVNPAMPGSTEEDDRIEYKEIDPISTNALAIVTKHYLDDNNDDGDDVGCPR
ncbi:unnamed protein product [Echinostoma caproni]|uniref:Spliced glycoprotein U85.5 n=1 Tax=Echinostoma caproni TaxID=27848 RepID=A0A183AG87_9TREM|nr:unnamed protein product [Echinostoma caproni]